MSYQVQCEGATGLPVWTGDAAADCATVGGTVAWVEVGGWLPALSLADGGALAVAVLGLWALGFGIRVLRRQLMES